MHGTGRGLNILENMRVYCTSLTIGTVDLWSHASFFVLWSVSQGSAVTEAEVKFGYFFGEHHLAFKLADYAKLFSSMLPDSAIAKDFKYGRTKVTAILKVIAQDAWGNIEAVLRDSKYFSLQTDDTNSHVYFV